MAIEDPGPNPNSILNTIKTGLGIGVEDDAFDSELIIHINSSIMSLEQLGVPVASGFMVSSVDDEWADLIADISKFQALKGYCILKVKVVFDPPSTSFVLDSMNRTLTEMEWRLNAKSEESPS